MHTYPYGLKHLLPLPIFAAQGRFAHPANSSRGMRSIGAAMRSSFCDVSISQASLELDLCVLTASWSRYLFELLVSLPKGPGTQWPTSPTPRAWASRDLQLGTTDTARPLARSHRHSRRRTVQFLQPAPRPPELASKSSTSPRGSGSVSGLHEQPCRASDEARLENTAAFCHSRDSCSYRSRIPVGRALVRYLRTRSR